MTQDSIEALEEAVRALPDNLALRRQLAAALEKAGDADRALAQLEAALARAAAGEAGIPFVAVGIEEVLDMWLGQSEKKLHELFATARKKAPAILFFDEVDSLGGRRSGLRHESYRTLVTQFLSELDGVN